MTRLASRRDSPSAYPAELATAEPVIRLPAIRRDHQPVGGAEQFPGDLATPGGGDAEDGHQGRDDDPQPRLLHRLSPGRFIDVGVLRADILFQFRHRLSQGVGGGPFQLGDHPRRDRQAEQVLCQLPNGTLPQAVATGQESQQGLQPGAERPGRHTRRQRGTGAGSAGRAGKPVQAVFRHLGLDGRYLGDLVPAGVRVFAVEGLPALAAGRGHQGDGLLDLLGRHQGALLACVTGLPPSLPARCWLWRSAFDVGQVAGRRARGVGGVLVEAFGQLIDLPLKGLQPLLMLMDEGQDGRLGGTRYLVPEVSRNRWSSLHIDILRPAVARASSGRERLPDGQVRWPESGVEVTPALDVGHSTANPREQPAAVIHR